LTPHYEYKEVTMPLLPNKRLIPGGEQFDVLVMTYNKLLLAMLTREGGEGWVPDCATDFYSMVHAGLILTQRHGGFLSDDRYTYKEARVRLRRMVISTGVDTSEVPPLDVKGRMLQMLAALARALPELSYKAALAYCVPTERTWTLILITDQPNMDQDLLKSDAVVDAIMPFVGGEWQILPQFVPVNFRDGLINDGALVIA
jgi:hypothetical protein